MMAAQIRMEEILQQRNPTSMMTSMLLAGQQANQLKRAILHAPGPRIIIYEEAISVAKVELHVYPPLSYKMSSKRVGPLILDEKIDPGETLGDLLARLTNGNHEAWRAIFDAQTHEIRPIIITIFNGTALARSEAPQTCLSDGDQIAFRIAYGGG
jgi:sulfur carrier protein ThiS